MQVLKVEMKEANAMKRNPSLACALSILVPGLGYIYIGKKWLGAAILLAVIIIGNLNAIWLSIYAVSNTVPLFFWTDTVPRVLHRMFAIYGIFFWIWQAVDAYRLAKQLPRAHG
ncbi:MAG: hypothetical protein JSU76_01795 [Dehalococcoidia bacterium]|nr:MAG: hypothetical protein JSU76_01795 [Dehalococcoidia bacterium]